MVDGIIIIAALGCISWAVQGYWRLWRVNRHVGRCKRCQAPLHSNGLEPHTNKNAHAREESE